MLGRACHVRHAGLLKGDSVTADSQNPANSLLIRRGRAMLDLRLNRPRALNSLDPELIHRLDSVLRSVAGDSSCRFVLLSGQGERGFCAGGDIKFMAQALRRGEKGEVLAFLAAEYQLDLLVRRFSKPIIVLANGICMGGGLGLAAGADLVLATETTHMAMPESQIGFFPDVGATGWLFEKCPPGYPELLGVTGYPVQGEQSVQLGLATHLVPQASRQAVVSLLEGVEAEQLPGQRQAAAKMLARLIERETVPAGPARPDQKAWVREIFAGCDSLPELRDQLSACSREQELCRSMVSELARRSPTAMALTLMLLRKNQGQPMEAVFASDLAAASSMLDHPDFLEGVRARLEDRDGQPSWNPSDLDDIDMQQLAGIWDRS
jgi:enoyl-CoA hydratase/carnithine racemase